MTNCAELKEQGNTAFRNKNYFEALALYQKALDSCDESDSKLKSIIYCNVSVSSLKIEKVNEAIDAATKAIEADSQNAKAYWRRANASLATHALKDAFNDFVAAYKIDRIKQYYDDANKTKNLMLMEAMAHQDTDVIEEQPYVPSEPVVIPEFNVEYALQLTEDLKKDVRPREGVFLEMIKRVKELNLKMKNIVDVHHNGELIVVGDTHGQFQDVLNIFKQFGNPSRERPYLFNGDYVDRGSQGVEILCVLFAWKLADPECIYLNRGNHETDNMNQMYGFMNECSDKYTKRTFRMCSDLFNTLPVGYRLNDKILVVHGGLFADENLTIDDVNKLNRVRQPPESGPLNDILWSDPMDRPGLEPSPRGLTRTFGPDITERFLKKNNLDFIIRSHQVQEEGILEQHNGHCITVFSAPNYVGAMNNKAAVIVLTFDENGKLKNKEYKKYTALPVPDKYRPMRYASFGF